MIHFDMANIKKAIKKKSIFLIAGFLVCAVGLVRVADAVTIPEYVSLEGTRRGPTGYYMTMDDREAYIERVRTDPETREKFEKVKEIADEAVQGESMDILACGKAYLVTKDQKYLVPIRGLFKYYEKRWFTLFPHGSERRKRIGNQWPWGIKTALVGDAEAGKAYDLVSDALPADEERVARAWIKDCLDGLREWFEADDLKEYVGTGMNSNMTSMTVGRWLEWAVAIGYEDWIDWALYNPGKGPRYSAGFVHWLQGNIKDNRMWSEAPIYGRYFMYGTVPMGRYLTNYGGRNLFDVKSPDGGSVAGLMDGMIDITYPVERAGVGEYSFRCANWGEGSTGLRTADLFLINGPSNWVGPLSAIYQQTGDTKYGWFLKLAENTPKDVRLPKEITAPPAPCSVFPNAGVVMLRNTETSRYWMGDGPAVRVRGGEPARSAPGDALTIIMHGAGRLLYPDWDCDTYECYAEIGWKRSTIKRSTLCVDGREGWPFRTFYRKGFYPEVKYASLRGSPHGNDELERSLMVTEDYVVDLFHVRVQKERLPNAEFYGSPHGYYAPWSAAPLPEKDEHTFDWMLHGIGQQFADIPFAYEPSDEFRPSAWSYRWIEGERRRETDASFYVDWVQKAGGLLPETTSYGPLRQEWFDGRAAVRMRMLGEPGTIVFLGDGPIKAGAVDTENNPERRISLVCVRRKGTETLFATLHEPYKTSPKIRKFAYLHRPGKGEKNPAAGVKVSCAAYIDRLYLSFGQPGFTGADGKEGTNPPGSQLTIVTDADPSERITFSGEAYVRHAGTKLTARGEIASFCIAAPDVPREGGLVLNGKATPYRKAGDYVVYGGSPMAGPVRKDSLAGEQAPPTPRLDMSLPQEYVNIDADATREGWLVTRVMNLDTRRLGGRLVLESGEGLRTATSEVSFGPLEPEHYVERAFKLESTGETKTGTLVPVTVKMYGGFGRDVKLLTERKVDVAVGVVVERVARRYRMPKFEYPNGRVPGKLTGYKDDVMDHLLVRAPAYTVKVDLWNGLCRWVMDPTGRRRSVLSFYPYDRGHAVGREKGTYGVGGLKAPIGHPPLGAEGYDWRQEAKLAGTGTSEAGLPTVTFGSASNGKELTYTFGPEQVTLTGGIVDTMYHVDNLLSPLRATETTLGFAIPDTQWWQKEPKSIWPKYTVRPRRDKAAVEKETAVAYYQDFEQMEPGPIPGSIQVPAEKREALTIADSGLKSKRSLRIDLGKLAGKGKFWILIPSGPRDSTGKGRYMLNVWTRHEGVKGITSAEPFYVELNGVMGYDRFYNPSWWAEGTRDWFMFAKPKAGDGTAGILRIRCPGDPAQEGVVWIDDVKVTFVPE